MIVFSWKPSAWQGCWNERNRRFFYSCWVLKNRNRKVKELEWEMWRTGQGDRVKEPEWEMWRTGRGARRGKEPEWEMWRTGRGGGVDGVKNCSEKCEGLGRRRGPTVVWKEKFFLKNQKHEPNIVEITHLCIMHGVHTRKYLVDCSVCMYMYWIYIWCNKMITLSFTSMPIPTANTTGTR